VRGAARLTAARRLTAAARLTGAVLAARLSGAFFGRARASFGRRLTGAF
jgi:hypothetical protein